MKNLNQVLRYTFGGLNLLLALVSVFMIITDQSLNFEQKMIVVYIAFLAGFVVLILTLSNTEDHD